MVDYPILEIIPELLQKLSVHPTVLLQAPPGAGKSTVLPLHLLDAPWLNGKKIIMLEPRRLAAKSVAERLAEELEEETGQRAGYRVRFESRVSDETRIEVVTEGILTRVLQEDNMLEGVGLLVFDEFHERSLQADLALALARQVQQYLREDLKILIMSATLDTDRIAAAMGNAPLVTSSGRQFPVEIRYASVESDQPLPARVVPAVLKAIRETSGDILVFLPGSGEILRTQELIEADPLGARVVTLYGDLPFRKQQEAILPSRDGTRKIVLATSIAETSLTIEGITTVVDSGWARVPRFNPNSGITRLETVRVTRDAAEQRAGRAGRLGPGVCYRLWIETTHRYLVDRRKPEILEADLASLVLELYAWGGHEVEKLDWITVPPPGSVAQARDLLKWLGAIDDKGITVRGKSMLRLPTHPRLAHMLLEARTPSEKALVCDMAAVIEEKDPLRREAGTDIGLRIELLRKWRQGERVNAERSVMDRIEKLSAQWRRLLKTEADNGMPGHYEVGRCLINAFPERVAQQKEVQGETYTLANGRVARLQDHDPLSHEKWLCIAQLDLGEKQGRIFSAAAVDSDDLGPLAHDEVVVEWDNTAQKVNASARRMVGGLILKSISSPSLDEIKKNQLLFEKLREHGLNWIDWPESSRDLQSRIQSLRLWRPDEQWPDVSEEHLLNTVEDWMTPYLSGLSRLSELRKLDTNGMLLGLIPWQLQSRLDQLVPARLEVPSGSLIKVRYHMDGSSPVMEVRLQELFGMARTPTVNEGKVSIVMHLLSPGYKPVQVTKDLGNFWHNTYHEVRKELRMRYPKHSWPEDPWTAEAVRGVKKKKQ